MFLLVLSSAIAAAWAIRCLPGSPAWAPALSAQLTFLCLSLALMAFLKGGWREFGFTLTSRGLARAILISLTAASAIAGITIALLGGSGYRGPEIAGDPRALAILSLVVAPICEEVFFRGLLQGYLALRGHGRLAIALPAALFSAVHALPFSSAGATVLTAILAGALLLGFIAGHLRAYSGSLLHPILAHFWFNLLGYVISMAAGWGEIIVQG